MKLECKADNIQALQEGWFGNAPLQWQTPDEVAKEFGNKPIVVRPRIPGGRCWYEVEILSWSLEHYSCDWFDPADYYFNEPIDKSTVTLNAELGRDSFGTILTYSTLPDHMRPALKYYREDARGLRALEIVRHFCDDPGLAMIEQLREEHPDHTIEFTCMSKSYGTRNWRSVIWEVRNY